MKQIFIEKTWGWAPFPGGFLLWLVSVGVKGGLAKGKEFFLPFPNLKLLSVMKYERNRFTFLVMCDGIYFFVG